MPTFAAAESVDDPDSWIAAVANFSKRTKKSVEPRQKLEHLGSAARFVARLRQPNERILDTKTSICLGNEFSHSLHIFHPSLLSGRPSRFFYENTRSTPSESFESMHREGSVAVRLRQESTAKR